MSQHHGNGQPSLFDDPDGSASAVDETAADQTVGFDPGFPTLERIQLDARSWVDYAPGWVTGSQALFQELVETADWGQRSRWMYDRQVTEPRLTAGWSAASGLPLVPDELEAMRSALSQRYGVELDSVGLNLYRDGQDSVAWHGDRIARSIAEPTVVLVSLGEPRTFLLRPKGGGKSRRWQLGGGDLLVTGGRCQREWQHSVPKVASAPGPRISIAFRHGLYRPAYFDGPR